MKYVALIGLIGIFSANLQAAPELGSREVLLDNQAVNTEIIIIETEIK